MLEITINGHGQLVQEWNVNRNRAAANEIDRCEAYRKMMTHLPMPLVVVGAISKSIDDAPNVSSRVMKILNFDTVVVKADVIFPGFINSKSSDVSENDITVVRTYEIASPEIVCCNERYCVTSEGQTKKNATASTTPTMEEFYQEHRSSLPVGIRSRFCKRASQHKGTTSSSIPSQQSLPQHTILSYRDFKNAIDLLNPWFHYTELFHLCRTEYNISHRSIAMLSVQSLNKDILRELFVVLYGQKYMINAPDLHTELHYFITDFTETFRSQPQQIWFDLQLLNETYGNRNNRHCNVDLYIAANTYRQPSMGSLSTVRQSNLALNIYNDKRLRSALVEV